MKKLAVLIYHKLEYVVGYLRGFFWKLFLKKAGNRFLVSHSVRFQSPQNIVIGDDVSINFESVVDGHAPLKIGNNVRIGYRVLIITGGHRFEKPDDLRKNRLICKPITIEDDCWIAAQAIILPGVTVSRGTIVGAGAVVTKTFPPNSIIGGNPAKVIKKRLLKN